MIILSILLGALLFVLALPTLADLLALLRIRQGYARPPAPPPEEPPCLLFLVPAHDEALLIGECVRSLVELHYPYDRRAVVVIADNCRDHTAVLARAAGVTCLERNDPAQPGKPHAIAWALTQLGWRSFDAVVIVDADSVVRPEFATALARSAPLRGKAVQGYHMVRNPRETALTRLGALLSAANHLFAYPLKQRAALNTPLLGNGMCLGTDVLSVFGWPAFTICEDWEMYATLTAAGVRIDGAPLAQVASQEARTLAQSASQRRRWTAGKLTVLGRYASALLGSREIDRIQKLDALAELSAPGAALHLGLVISAAAAALVFRPPGAILLAAGLAATLLRPVMYSLAALRIDPEPRAVLRALAFLPVYTVWRLGVALGALANLGDRPWVRTARHATPNSTAPHPR